MWPFSKDKQPSGIQANAVTPGEGLTIIDVRGQTCPGYLLAINKAVANLPAGTTSKLLITYPPCGDDVKAWARERNIEYQGIERENDMWIIRIRK